MQWGLDVMPQMRKSVIRVPASLRLAGHFHQWDGGPASETSLTLIGGETHQVALCWSIRSHGMRREDLVMDSPVPTFGIGYRMSLHWRISYIFLSIQLRIGHFCPPRRAYNFWLHDRILTLKRDCCKDNFYYPTVTFIFMLSLLLNWNLIFFMRNHLITVGSTSKISQRYFVNKSSFYDLT